MSTPSKSTNRTREGDSEIVLPLHGEELEVSKRRLTSGRVRVSRVTTLYEAVLNELLAFERVVVDRVPVGEFVASMPEIRQEGDTIIIPIVEETPVIERRLMLTEELRVRRIRGEKEYRESVMLRKQEALVTRLPAEESAAKETVG